MIKNFILFMYIASSGSSLVSCVTGDTAASRAKQAGMRPCNARDVMEDHCVPPHQAKAQGNTSKF